MSAAPDSPRADIPLLATTDTCPHYLDNAATALMPTAVLTAMAAYDQRARGNIGRGIHPFAEAADEAYQNARRTVADALSTDDRQIVFTGGCTAALNVLAQGLAGSLADGDSILLSVAEHHSNIVPWQIMAQRRGFRLHFGGVDRYGGIDTDDIVRQIERHRPRVVALTHASNVSGVVNDFSAVADAAKTAGAVLAVDGAQAVPHHLPNPTALGCDFYVFSAHKCYGPNGVGVLWGTPAALAALPPVVGGGGSIQQVRQDGFETAPPPRGLEAGTPPITQAIGMAAAFRWRRQWRDNDATNTHALALSARRQLSALPAVRCLFDETPSAIVAFTVDGVHPHDVCEWLGARGVAVRGGHHCAQPLMQQLGINGCVRASFAPYNNADDVAALVSGVTDAITALR